MPEKQRNVLFQATGCVSYRTKYSISPQENESLVFVYSLMCLSLSLKLYLKRSCMS